MDVIVLLSKLMEESNERANYSNAEYNKDVSERIKYLIKAGIRPCFNDVICVDGNFFNTFFVYRVEFECRSKESYLRVWAFEREQPFDTPKDGLEDIRNFQKVHKKPEKNQYTKGKILHLMEIKKN